MDYKNLIEKFKSTLGLNEEPIKFNILAGTQENQKKGSNLWYDDDKERWIIEFVEQHVFFLAHELGHIYLAKKYSCPYFAKQTRVPVNPYIGFYNVCIVDSFVNYNISRYDFIYSYFLDLMDIYLNRGKDGPDPNTPHLLGFYLNLFLDMNYCLKQEDFNERSIDINNYFNKFEDLIRRKEEITKQQFNKIKSELIKFKDFKDKESNISVIYFILKILKLIPFWSQNKVAKNVRLIYNIEKT